MQTVDRQAVDHLGATFVAQVLEVGEGTEVDVWRVVPVYGMKSETGMWPLVARYQRQRQWPKLGKVMMHSRPTRSISSRMRSGYSTACRAWVMTTTSKLLLAKLPRPLSVLLDDVDTFGHTGGDVVGVDLQPVAGDVLAIAQRGQQLAVAAAQVEYPAAGGDPVVDDFGRLSCCPQMAMRFM